MFLRPIPALTLDDKIRFWNKVQAGPHCHLWVGEFNRANRCNPMIKMQGDMFCCSRIAWFIETGEDPGDLLVLHDCKPLPDNFLCMNPSHLWLGDHSENMIDAVQKGQHLAGGYKRIFLPRNILEIRQLYKDGKTLKEIADKHGCGISTIHRIVTYQSYPEVT